MADSPYRDATLTELVAALQAAIAAADNARVDFNRPEVRERLRMLLIAAAREIEPGCTHTPDSPEAMVLRQGHSIEDAYSRAADQASAWLRRRLLTRAARLVMGEASGDDWVYDKANTRGRPGSRALSSPVGLREALEMLDAMWIKRGDKRV